MCMYTSLVDRTPGPGLHANFSAGVASAKATSCCDTCVHSGIFCANAGELNTSQRKSAFAQTVFMLASIANRAGKLVFSALAGASRTNLSFVMVRAACQVWVAN